VPALTVDEAAARAADLSVDGYAVHLDFTQGAERFTSRTRIAFRSAEQLPTFVDVAAVEIQGATLNGKAMDGAAVADARLPLTGLRRNNTLDIEATMAYSSDGEGLHRSVDPEDQLVYLYAMAAMTAAPRIYACFDQPDLKAPYRLTVTAPEDWVVLGNAPATRQAGGVWTLTETLPLATYFVTLVAGPYHSIGAEHDGIPLGLHCRQSLARHLDEDARELFDVTAACFDEYHRLFGIRYPFGEYHQVFVPECSFGAMENPGCVTFSDDLVFKAKATESLRASRAMVVAHEMAHQWFGDLVTMTWWDDLWLNESFAELMGYRVTSEVTRFRDVLVEFALGRKAWGMAADQRRSTHAVAGNGARDAEEAQTRLDGITYTKGAAVLRQLNAYLGDEAFIGGVVAHLRTHAFGNATLADLVGAWEQSSGKDVGAWADAWLGTSGVDVLACEVGPDGEVAVHRHSRSNPLRSRPHSITVTAFDEFGTATAADVVAAGDRTVVPLPTFGPSRPVFVIPDSADQTWAKIELDDRSAAAAPQSLARVDDPLARAVVWGALREALLDRRTSPDCYLEVLSRTLPRESDLAVDVLLGGATGSGAIGLIGRYFRSSHHRARLEALVGRLLTEAEPASNRQLIAARQTIDVTSDAGLLHRWSAGDVPEGLLDDADLRWRTLISRCALDAAGQADIDELRREDPSSQGALHALRARSSMPTAAAKEWAWRAITTDTELSNYELYAVSERFFRPDQSGVTGDYVERYFAEIPDTAGIRSGRVAEQAALLTYPRYSVSELTLDLAERCLRREDLSSSVRRSISDGTDDLRRLLRGGPIAVA
jgi:aminopeptidase N